MSQILKSEAIVLQRKIVKEADLQADLQLVNGKLGVVYGFGMAKGTRRAGLLLQPGNVIYIVYRNYRHQFLNYEDGTILAALPSRTLGYEALLIISYLLDLTRQSLRFGQEHPLGYLLLKGSLAEVVKLRKDQISSVKNNPIRERRLRLRRLIFLLIFFQVRFLKYQGFIGDFQNCSSCDGLITDKSHWKIPEFSFFCASCCKLQKDRIASVDDFQKQKFLQLTMRRYKEYQGLIESAESAEYDAGEIDDTNDVRSAGAIATECQEDYAAGSASKVGDTVTVTAGTKTKNFFSDIQLYKMIQQTTQCVSAVYPDSFRLSKNVLMAHKF